MAFKTWFSALPVVVACGGTIAPTAADESATQGAGAGKSAPPIPTGIPTAPLRSAGTKRCSPLEQPATIDPVTPTKPAIVGSAGSIYVIDADPERPGRHRAFIQRFQTLERHALSEDDATPGTFIIDRGLPNQIVLTSTSIQGGGVDGPLHPVSPEHMAVITAYANDSPESLAWGPPGHSLRDGVNLLFVLGPVANGVLAVPRVFYGPADAIQERTFLGFTPSDSSETATAATAVTFDLDGTPTTLPTVVTRETAGLINGFGSGWMTFLCF
ncbi:MAG: hypothetical protein KIT84_38480 [Labilithrix sp.]|nr:hypothetical protein [Labilithrix sp.]MCW5816948.1 hypothetical protein [Labilithrix sp.]